MRSDLAYRHTQTYTTLWIILLITSGVSFPILMRNAGQESQLGLLIVALSLGCALLVMGRLVIEVDSQAVRWSFGYLGWPAWHTSFAEIASTEVAKANVVFGSGIKGTPKHRQFNVKISGPALRLHLSDGRSITLGTPEPARLQGFIDTRLSRERR